MTSASTYTINLEQILDLAKKNGAASCEVIQKSRTENPVSFENNKLKSLESNEHSGIAVRLIKNNRIGIASSTDPDAIESLVTAAIEASEFGPEATFEFAKEKLEHLSSEPRAASSALPLEDLVERGTRVIERLKPFHKDLVVSGGFDLKQNEIVYLNTSGVNGRRTKTIYSTFFHALLVSNDDFLGIYDGNSDLSDFPDDKQIAEKIFEKLNYSRKIIPIPTKKYPVVFTARAVADVFYEVFSEVLNGKAIEQAISPLVDKLGKKLFDEKLTLREDSSIGISKTSFDDEGIKTQKKDLIKSGTISSFYFDLSTANKMKCKDIARNTPMTTTGNGFKPSLQSPPVPVLTSVVIEGGKSKYDNLISNIKEGVLVDQLLGAGQSNTLAGEFSVGIDLGFLIKDGKIAGRIKNCMIAGNIFEVLKNITDLSLEKEWVNGSMLFPAMLIEDMTVAGK